jgi:hypothetical protein
VVSAETHLTLCDSCSVSCDVRGINCLEPCSDCNVTWVCHRTRPVCGCESQSCLLGNELPPTCNTTAECQNPLNTTKTQSNSILERDALKLFKKFCPRYQPGSSTFTCGTGGVETQVLTACNVSHVLRRNRAQPRETEKSISYSYNVSRNGLAYAARVKCRRNSSM